MRRPILHTLPLMIALAFGSGWAAAQTTNGGTSNTGPSHSTMAGIGAAQPGSPSDTTHASSANQKSGDQKLSHGDKKFIEDAAKGGMFEVQSGQLAAQKASDAQVKEFANKLVQDHTKANDELKQIAEARGVQMPDKEKWMDRHEINKLQKLSGDKFDHEFAQHEVKDHEKDIKKFAKATSNLKDPDLKAWADKQLPVLRQHLAMAQKLQQAGNQQSASSNPPNTRAAGNKGSKS
jgi:putative membrane protein